MDQAEIIDTSGTYHEYRGVVNPSGLVVYKGSNTRVVSNGDCNKKVKAESKVKV